MFPNELEDKKLELFSLGAAMVATHKKSTLS